MTHYREDFLFQFCDSCIKPKNLAQCGTSFEQIFEPIRCPDSLLETHSVCKNCLELHAKKYQHESSCLFTKIELRLNAFGWSTPASRKVAKSFKQKRSTYLNPLRNLIINFLEGLSWENKVVVPIPMGNVAVWKFWNEFLAQTTSSVEGTELIPLIKRNKQNSTRKSVAQIRSRIAKEEYEISLDSDDLIKGKNVILLDDNVTTGHTMIHCAEMLRSFNPSNLVVLALDRTISPRTLQRCLASGSLECAVKVPINQNV